MKTRKLVIVIGFVFVGFYSLSQFSPNKSKRSSSEDGYSSKQLSSSLSSPTLPNAIDLDFQHEDNALSNDDSSAHGSALKDELLLIANSEQAFENLLAELSKNGFRILSSNEKLRAIRLKIETQRQQNQLQRTIGDDVFIGPNYLVYSPLPYIPEITGPAGEPFRNSALNSMGVTRENQAWGEGIKVAVLDSGIGPHQELQNIKIDTLDLIDNNSGSTSEALDIHGTAVASLIAGKNTGIAPSASLLNVRVLDSNGQGDSFTLAAGIIEAVDKGSDIISMSLGSFGYSPLLENAVNYAESKGVILVASTGNDGISEITYPAKFESVIAVSAVDANSQLAGFSNHGVGVDISAPGVGVLSAWEEENWSYFSGTSASVPYVSGAIAAVLSQNPEISSSEAQRLITQYANDTGAPGLDTQSGNGVLNLQRIIDRNTAGIYDVAISDFYVKSDNNTSDLVSIEITIQNRGTESLSSLNLKYQEQSGYEQSRLIEGLLPNETTSYSVPVPRIVLDSLEGYEISASIEANGVNDAKMENNSKTAYFHRPSEDTNADQ